MNWLVHPVFGYPEKHCHEIGLLFIFARVNYSSINFSLQQKLIDGLY